MKEENIWSIKRTFVHSIDPLEQKPLWLSEEDYAAGMGPEDNFFEYQNNTQNWQFNLTTKNYIAPGIYTISMISGVANEYMIETYPESFVIE